MFHEKRTDPKGQALRQSFESGENIQRPVVQHFDPEGPIQGNGHHRVVVMADVDPQREVPVVYGANFDWDEKLPNSWETAQRLPSKRRSRG
jgi:hypothetical protein